jgi:hypothetical protein
MAYVIKRWVLRYPEAYSGMINPWTMQASYTRLFARLEDAQTIADRINEEQSRLEGGFRCYVTEV